MDNTIEYLQVDFNNRASSIFFNLYKGFLKAVSPLDRQGQENVFQQQQGKYAALLKQELEAVARECMNRNKEPQNARQLEEVISYQIRNYIAEFSQKIKSL